MRTPPLLIPRALLAGKVKDYEELTVGTNDGARQEDRLTFI